MATTHKPSPQSVTTANPDPTKCRCGRPRVRQGGLLSFCEGCLRRDELCTCSPSPSQSAASTWCPECSESYPDATAADAHTRTTGHVLTAGPKAPSNLSAAALAVFSLLRSEGPRALRGDRELLAKRLGLEVPALSAAVRELHNLGHLFFDATRLLTFSEVPGGAPVHHPGALAQKLEDAQEELRAALAVLPTHAPTAEDIEEDPTALGTCLSEARMALEVVALRLAGALAMARAGASPDAAPALVARADVGLAAATCAHEATPSAPFTCTHCGDALPRDFYERKDGAPVVGPPVTCIGPVRARCTACGWRGWVPAPLGEPGSFDTTCIECQRQGVVADAEGVR